MAARRVRSLMQGDNKEKDGVVWHREHRSKRGRHPVKRYHEFKLKMERAAKEERKRRKFEK